MRRWEPGARALALVAVTAMALCTPARAQGDGILLFYNGANGRAVTGLADPTGNYRDARRYPFSPWTHIAPTRDGLVLFYYGQGRAATGRVDAAGNDSGLRSYSGFTRAWTHVVPARAGAVGRRFSVVGSRFSVESQRQQRAVFAFNRELRTDNREPGARSRRRMPASITVDG